MQLTGKVFLGMSSAMVVTTTFTARVRDRNSRPKSSSPAGEAAFPKSGRETGHARKETPRAASSEPSPGKNSEAMSSCTSRHSSCSGQTRETGCDRVEE